MNQTLSDRPEDDAPPSRPHVVLPTPNYLEPLGPALRELRRSILHERPMSWPNFRRCAHRAAGQPDATALQRWRTLYTRAVTSMDQATNAELSLH